MPIGKVQFGSIYGIKQIHQQQASGCVFAAHSNPNNNPAGIAASTNPPKLRISTENHIPSAISKDMLKKCHLKNCFVFFMLSPPSELS